MKNTIKLISFLISFFVISNLAIAKGGIEPISDPIEPINRVVFSFNQMVDDYLLKPAAKGYRVAIPQAPRTRIRSVVTNLKEPLNFVNAILQLDAERTFTSFWRFLINSTASISFSTFL